MAIHKLLLLTTNLALLTGCTSQQLYSSAQSWQRNQCGRIFDKQERERCMSSTRSSYEEYRQQTGAAQEDN